VRRPSTVLAVAAIFLLVLSGCGGANTPKHPPHLRGTAHRAQGKLRLNGGAQGTPVCGQALLNSPYSYNGAAGPYPSGTPGLPTYGSAGTDFPSATAGKVLPADATDYPSYALTPDTVYYLLPGTHTGAFQADTGDAFVGGRAGSTVSILDGQDTKPTAIDSNSTNGNQPGVTIEYLTIQHWHPSGDAGAINAESNTGWTLQYDTVIYNLPGAGMIAGADNTLVHNCLTLNGQYGFQSVRVNSWGADTVTDGPYNVTVQHNEISYNDTCDHEGLLNAPAIGWVNHNPVPPQYRPANCGVIVPAGNQGGFKLWQTDGVTISDNYIHNNWGPGGWADTNNSNTTWANNTITWNDAPAIEEEISYNFSVTGNYMADNDWVIGVSGSGAFPSPAVYVSESGSDTIFGGVPACPEPSCSGQGAYTAQSVISGNTMVDNAGGVFLWANPSRYCSSGHDGVCSLVDGGTSGPFSETTCAANLPTSSVNVATYTGNITGSPAENWWDGCQRLTTNVATTSNTIDFNPVNVAYCTPAQFPACGANGIFSAYGSFPNGQPGYLIPTAITFWRGNTWSGNIYNGPSTFDAWSQGSGANPVSWANWSGPTSGGDKCSSAGEQSSGFCSGPFGQDTGSTFNAAPLPPTPTPSGCGPVPQLSTIPGCRKTTPPRPAAGKP
jgi:hypothetical protein